MEVDFLLLSYESQGLSSGCQTWSLAPLTAEPSHWPTLLFESGSLPEPGVSGLAYSGWPASSKVLLTPLPRCHASPKHDTALSFFCGCWESKLKPPSLHSKHFPNELLCPPAPSFDAPNTHAVRLGPQCLQLPPYSQKFS